MAQFEMALDGASMRCVRCGHMIRTIAEGQVHSKDCDSQADEVQKAAERGFKGKDRGVDQNPSSVAGT